MSTWTYICIFSGANFPSIPFHVPRYPSSFDRAREAKLGRQRSCDRIPVRPVSRTGTIRPATGTREVSFCLAKIRPVNLTPKRTDLTVAGLTSYMIASFYIIFYFVFCTLTVKGSRNRGPNQGPVGGRKNTLASSCYVVSRDFCLTDRMK